MKLKNLISILVIQNYFILMATLPEPYSQIKEVLPFNDHGWYDGNAFYIEKLMTLNKVKTVIEVGSWLGKSTRHIASLLQSSGKLYAVDTWAGSTEHYNGLESGMLQNLYEQFLSNIIHAKLTDIVIPVRMQSQQAAPIFTQKLTTKVDLIYIDAAHDTKSVMADLKAYWPFVANNKGILCGDDWTWQTVRVAVEMFASHHGLTVCFGGNFWFLKREGVMFAKKDLESLLNNPDEVFIFSTLQ
jgi:hypothetical protein